MRQAAIFSTCVLVVGAHFCQLDGIEPVAGLQGLAETPWANLGFLLSPEKSNSKQNSSGLPLQGGGTSPQHCFLEIQLGKGWRRPGRHRKPDNTQLKISPAPSKGLKIFKSNSAFQLKNFHFQTLERQKSILFSQSITYWLSLSVISTLFQLF